MKKYGANCGEIPALEYQEVGIDEEEENSRVNMMREDRPILSDFVVKSQGMWKRY